MIEFSTPTFSWLTLVLFVALALALLLCDLYLQSTRLSLSLQRKIMHVKFTFLIIGTTFLTPYTDYIYAGGVFALLLYAARRLNMLRSLSDRRSDSWGEILYPLGAALTALVSPDQTVFIVAILALGLGDTAAYYVGTRVKRWHITATRSIPGSSACMLVTALLVVLFGYPVPVALVVGLSTMVAEMLSSHGTDNVTIPTVAAFALASLI